MSDENKNEKDILHEIGKMRAVQLRKLEAERKQQNASSEAETPAFITEREAMERIERLRKLKKPVVSRAPMSEASAQLVFQRMAEARLKPTRPAKNVVTPKMGKPTS